MTTDLCKRIQYMGFCLAITLGSCAQASILLEDWEGDDVADWQLSTVGAGDAFYEGIEHVTSAPVSGSGALKLTVGEDTPADTTLTSGFGARGDSQYADAPPYWHGLWPRRPSWRIRCSSRSQF